MRMMRMIDGGEGHGGDLGIESKETKGKQHEERGGGRHHYILSYILPEGSVCRVCACVCVRGGEGLTLLR